MRMVMMPVVQEGASVLWCAPGAGFCLSLCRGRFVFVRFL